MLVHLQHVPGEGKVLDFLVFILQLGLFAIFQYRVKRGILRQNERSLDLRDLSAGAVQASDFLFK